MNPEDMKVIRQTIDAGDKIVAEFVQRFLDACDDMSDTEFAVEVCRMVKDVHEEKDRVMACAEISGEADTEEGQVSVGAARMALIGAASASSILLAARFKLK